MDKVRILVADDSQFMRVAYKRILETQDNFEVVGMAEDGEEALDKALSLVPEVAVLDVRMPKMDGLEAAHKILEQHPQTAIIMISAYDDITFVRELFKNGPERKAYLLKNSLDDIGELIRVVDVVLNGQTVLDNRILQKLARLSIRQDRSLLAMLTEPEQQVLELMAEGYGDSDIAQNLHLDREQVEECAHSIYGKLGLSETEGRDRRSQAIAALVQDITGGRYVLENEASS